jgi:two-component system response regulator AtoC
MKPLQRRRILVVDDESKMLRVLELQLETAGFAMTKADTAEIGVKLLDNSESEGKPFDLVLTDLRLPGMDGLEFLKKVRNRDAPPPVIVMTAFGTVETAVEAMKSGASDYLLKPFSLEDMMITIEKVLELHALRRENRELKSQLTRRYDFGKIIGHSEKMAEIFETAERVAATRATVLLGGESGVGKGMLARAIHLSSPRKDAPFVKITCSAIPENLMESELFGYEKGAFTGAIRSHAGKFEQADGGTVFLDEIGDVPPPVQVKLLRVLQEREFERLGGDKTIQVDVRIIAATNQDLLAALEQGAFREDLYYRLNVVPVNLPPLRERKEDIPALVDHFLERFAQDTGDRVRGISKEALDRLRSYHWPGNVRELENIIQRSMVLAQGEIIEAGDIQLDNAGRPSTSHNGEPSFLPDGMTLDEYEQEIIREAMRRADNNKSQAARLLGLTRNALRYRLSQMGMDEGG